MAGAPLRTGLATGEKGRREGLPAAGKKEVAEAAGNGQGFCELVSVVEKAKGRQIKPRRPERGTWRRVRKMYAEAMVLHSNRFDEACYLCGSAGR